MYLLILIFFFFFFFFLGGGFLFMYNIYGNIFTIYSVNYNHYLKDNNLNNNDN